jgi:adenylate cyclase
MGAGTGFGPSPGEARVERRLAAILAADVVGYSRLMGDDEAGTLARLKAHRSELIDPEVSGHNGRVVKLMGDGALVEFASVVDAVACAVAIQREMAAHNARVHEDRRIAFRMGINLGDVIVDGDDIYGEGINIAARLEGLAEPGGICVSRTVFNHVKGKVDFGFEDLGEQTVKNIAEPVRVYRVLLEAEAAGKVVEASEPAKARRRRPALAGALVALVALAGVLLWQRPWAPDVERASLERMAFPLPEKPSIAVLPFDNLSGDPEQEYFADGVTEDIIATISRIPDLFVVARNSTFTYKDKPVKVREVAEEMGVRHVLEGSVQRSGDRVRITAQLIDATTGNHAWAERYDREVKDIFVLQDEIALSVAHALHAKLASRHGAEARVRDRTTSDLDAWELYIRGSAIYRTLNQENMLRARELWRQAIEIDSNYAAAWAGISFSHLAELRIGWSREPKLSYRLAKEHAEKALALDPDLPTAHAVMAFLSLYARRHEEAIGAGNRALAIDPNNTSVLYALADIMRYAGRFEEAIELIKRAMRLNPNYPEWYLQSIGMSYFHSGQNEKSIGAFTQLVRRNPSYNWAHAGLAMNYGALGRLEDARREADAEIAINPKISLRWIREVVPYKNKAQIAEITEILGKAGIPEEQALPLPDKPSIAVLPFANMSGDPEQSYFADGMSEDLITDLSKISGLFVIARNSSFAYKGKAVDVKRVSRELGVRYVLEGSVRRAGDQVRINAQLIDAQSGGHLWAERYDGTLDDVFALQDRVTRKIVAALALNLTPGEERRQAERETDNPEAYDAFLQGWEFYRRFTAEDFVKAVPYFERAVALDPDYGHAYAALAATYFQSWLRGYKWTAKVNPGDGDFLSWNGAREKSEEYLELAMQAPTPLAHRLASRMHSDYRQFDKAVVEAERAVGLDPNDPEGYLAMAWALIFTGRAEEAVGAINKGMRLDPRYPATYLYALGVAQLGQGQYEAAATALERALTRNPENKVVHAPLAAANAYLGRAEKARAALNAYIGSYDWLSKVDGVMGWWPFRREADVRRFGGGLVKAGLCCAERLEAYIEKVRAGGTLE